MYVCLKNQDTRFEDEIILLPFLLHLKLVRKYVCIHILCNTFLCTYDLGLFTEYTNLLIQSL